MAKLRIDLQVNSSGLNAGLKSASGKLKQFGSKISSIGASMQRFALPLAIAGGAAIKMGADFDKSMTKIKSLVGIAGDEVDKMGKQVRQMAIETGVSSTKAADALFFITSAGLRGEEAMDVLNASLKASAVGLGEVTQVADAATSAMNAYGSDVLSASGATDVLVAAVREGKLSSEELASSIGQVIPIASNMGVTFNEVGATLAAMSRTGTTAATAAMQLKNILMMLLKPTKEGADTLAEMGLSSEMLQKKIKDEGLLSTLELLKVHFEHNSDAQAKVFGSTRALKGILDLTWKRCCGFNARVIFKNMENVLGDTQKAFDENAKSAGFKLTKALNTAKESFAQMGAILLNTLLPLIQDLTGLITRLFKSFNKLDPGMQKFISAIGVLIIILPTLIGLFGTLTTIVGALLSPIGLVVLAIGAIGLAVYKNWAIIAPALVDIYNKFVDLHNGSEKFRAVLYTLEYVFKKAFISMKAGVDHLINGISTLFKVAANKLDPKAMSLAIAQGFAKSEEITKKSGEELALAFSENLNKTLGATLEHKTVEQLDNSIKNIIKKAKGTISGLLSGDVFGGAAGGDG